MATWHALCYTRERGDTYTHRHYSGDAFTEEVMRNRKLICLFIGNLTMKKVDCSLGIV